MTDYAGRLRCRDHPDYAVTWRGTGCVRCAVEARRRRDERKTTTENVSKRDGDDQPDTPGAGHGRKRVTPYERVPSLILASANFEKDR